MRERPGVGRSLFLPQSPYFACFRIPDSGNRAALPDADGPQIGRVELSPTPGVEMKTYRILIGNCEELLSDFIEALFQEACSGQASVECVRKAKVREFVAQGCEEDFDLVIQVPHNLFPEVSAPTPIGLIGESIRSIRAIKARRSAPLISIVAAEERGRYEPLLLEAGADCVLELPFGGEELRTAVAQLLRLPAKCARPLGKPWFFAGVLMRGFRRLSQA